MERRRFLTSLLGGAIAAHELDIEKLLWVPGQKTIFIPPPRIYRVTILVGLPPYQERWHWKPDVILSDSGWH